VILFAPEFHGAVNLSELLAGYRRPPDPDRPRMLHPLDIHVANDEERRAAHANVYDVWARGATVEEHVNRRDASPLHRRGRWIVGCVAGRVVTSLASHAVSFRLHGQSVPAIAIGSVHTMAEHRGRGFAPRLLEWTERFEHQQGARLSVLFSDIKPDYYARLGYRRCPAHRGFAEAEAFTTDTDGSLDGFRLEPFAADQGRDEMQRLYAADYGREPLSMEHAGEYGRHLADRRPDDVYCWLVSESQHAGYVRLTRAGDLIKIADYAVAPSAGEETAREALFRLVIAQAATQGAKRIGGWFPDSASARACFRLEDRPDEITMIKPLDAALEVDDACLAAADRLVEIDHV